MRIASESDGYNKSVNLYGTIIQNSSQPTLRKRAVLSALPTWPDTNFPLRWHALKPRQGTEE